MLTSDLVHAEADCADAITFEQISGYFGAKVDGIDLGQPLDSAAIARIWEGLDTYRVLLFRGQHNVEPAQLLRFASYFGTPETAEHPSHPNREDAPGVKVLVSNANSAMGNMIDSWHTDGCTRENTFYLSVLQAIDVPRFGRDTMFADMVTAYERLSAPMRVFCDGLTGEHNWGNQKPGSPSVYHPLVLTDRRTGKKALYANRIYTKSIKELRADESAAMLDLLMNQARIPELQLRVQWEPGTIVMWNNETTQHYLVLDRDYERVLHRVMVS